MSSDAGDADAFFSLLTEVGVPQELQTALSDAGIVSIADFAYSYISTADLSSFIQNQPTQLWTTLGVTDPEHCPATARLRRALDKCKALTKAADLATPGQGTISSNLLQSPAPNVWAEHAPPRLDNEAVQRMVEQFRNAYTSEHLDADSMPSIRLLSLVHQWFKPHGSIKWIPWQLRLSAKQYQELIEARTAKTLRTEAQLISTALFDETPEQSIDRAFLSPTWLSRCQTVMRNAIALCNGAHLRILKAFDAKVFELATQSLAPDSGLRTVQTAELLQADRKLWSELALLHSEGWSLDQALHEMTKVRSDMHALLQPRAKQVVVYKGTATTGKGKGKDSKSKGAKGVIQSQLKETPGTANTLAMSNLATKHGNKTLCLRFNRGQCSNAKCKYAHLCAIKLPNGQACGQRHAAHAHRFRNTAPSEQSAAPAASAAPGT